MKYPPAFRGCDWTVGQLKTLATAFADEDAVLILGECAITCSVFVAMYEAIRAYERRPGRTRGLHWFNAQDFMDGIGWKTAGELDDLEDSFSAYIPGKGGRRVEIIPLPTRGVRFNTGAKLNEAEAKAIGKCATHLPRVELLLRGGCPTHDARVALLRDFASFPGDLVIDASWGDGSSISTGMARLAPAVLRVRIPKTSINFMRTLLEGLDLTKIRELALVGCDLRDDEIRWICDRFRRAPNLALLDLRDNNLGLEAARAVYETHWPYGMLLRWFGCPERPNLPHSMYERPLNSLLDDAAIPPGALPAYILCSYVVLPDFRGDLFKGEVRGDAEIVATIEALRRMSVRRID